MHHESEGIVPLAAGGGKRFRSLGAVFDLVRMVQSVCLRLEATLPEQTLIDNYRQRADQLFRPEWDNARFDLLWDHR
jgi:hypothetical protein